MVGTPRVQYFNTSTGTFMSGGKLYTYAPGTTTLQATYKTVADAVALTNANTNPIILDTRGEADLVLTTSTRLMLYDANDNLVWDKDTVGASGINVFDANGNSLVAYTQATSAVNYFTIANAPTGSPPTITATGSDTNIGIGLIAKGTGTVAITGNAAVSGTQTVSGAATLSSTAHIVGAATLDSTLAVTGATTLTGNTTVVGTFNRPPTGTITWFASATPPAEWLTCDGSAVSRTTYAALFAVTGTTFGTGDGSTTFNLPNQARNTIVGKGGSGSATLANTVGATGGEETHTLTTPEIPAHTHTYLFPGSTASGSTPNAINAAAGNSTATGSAGGGGAHNNMQPSLVLNMIIKT